MARKSRGSNVTLPWERRGTAVRQMLRGPRWKVAVASLVLLGMSSLLYGAATDRSRERGTRETIDEVHRAIGLFRAQIGRCPRSITELVHPPRSRTRYLRAAPKDGWGQELWVRCPAHNDPDGADVLSAGPSGSFLVDDNIR
ncbi:MAG: type II secretion system protein GspG [Myxococcota bacterium]